ncbi:MAG TPA: hypothetical protein VGM56_13860 [Byssovorax sp.]
MPRQFHFGYGLTVIEAMLRANVDAGSLGPLATMEHGRCAPRRRAAAARSRSRPAATHPAHKKR